MQHSSATVIHRVYAWAYADATEREAADGFVLADLGKIAWQQDNNTFWVLVDDSPITWVQFGGSTDATAIHTDASSEIDGLTEKATPVAGDWVIIEDSEDSFAKKKVNVGNLGGGSDFPITASFFMDEATATVGNAFTLTLDGSQQYGWFRYQNTAANGDTWTQHFFLKAGTYTIYVLGLTDPSRGKQDVYIDGVNVGTIDWYSAGLVYKVVKTIASVTISTDGDHEFKSVINGKNGSSSGYYLILTKVWIN